MFKKLFRKEEQRSKEELELISFVLKKFAYRPQNISYFVTAITHKSLANNDTITYSNERLEYLGDAILDAVIAELLYLRFPNEDEGYLTKIKSKVVSRKTLSEIAEALDLKSIIRYHKGRTINLSTLEGNAFEAIIGAIYLDGGFEAVKKTINHHIFRKYADLNKILEEEIDFKSRLFIWCQKSHLTLEFVVVKEENIQGNWQYEIEVLINEKAYGRGIGNSKKSAEQAASKETLVLVGEIEA
ncbi:MAG: ribonuclease III [Flavobacteriia bacterium]